MPGVAIGPRAARRAGLAATAVAVTGLLVWQAIPDTPDQRGISVTVLTEQIGTGIERGSEVRFGGVRVGSVTGIEREATGRQRLRLRLDRADSAGLTDALSLDYAPGNLFGISEVVLAAGTGGTPLTEAAVVDLTGANAARAVDATIATLLKSLGQFTDQVLTPQLTTLLGRIATDTHAFAPLVQTIVATAQAVADTQRLSSSLLLERYGTTLQGVPPTARGLVALLNGPFSNEYFGQPGKVEKFDANVNMIKDDLFGAAVRVLDTGQAHYSGFLDLLAPLLSALSRTVPTPEKSEADLAELLRRLDAALPDNGSGPTLTVALQAVPGVAQPLAAMLGTNAPGGAR